MNREVLHVGPEGSLNPPALSQEPRAPMHDDSPLDQAMVADLRKNDPPFLAEAIHQFLRDMPIHFVAVCHAVANGDDQGLISAAHAFNESCGFIGAKSLGDLCLWFEKEGRAGDVRRLVPVLPYWEREYFRTQMTVEIELVSFPIGSE